MPMKGSNNKLVLFFLSWGSFIIHYHVKAQNAENGFVHHQLQYIGMRVGGIDQWKGHDYILKTKIRSRTCALGTSCPMKVKESETQIQMTKQ